MKTARKICKKWSLYVALIMLIGILGACSSQKTNVEQKDDEIESIEQTQVDETATEQEVLGTVEAETREEKQASVLYLPVKYTVYTADDSISGWGECTYDENGNALISTRYDNDGSINHQNEYEYDGMGNVIVWTYYNAGGKTQKEYVYDQSGNIITENSYIDDSLNSSFEYTYDEYGNRLTEKDFYPVYDFSSEWKYEYTYDENGNVLTEKFVNIDDASSDFGYYREYTYNNGVRSHYCTYDQDGSLAEECTYDKNGNIIESISYNTDGSIYYGVRQSYDVNNNLLKMEQTANGDTWTWTEWIYNEEGNYMMKRTDYYSDGSIKEYIVYEDFLELELPAN